MGALEEARLRAAAWQWKPADARRDAELRQLLLKRAEWFEARVLEAAARHGYPFVTPAMNRFFACLGREPVSLSALARRLGITRQSAHLTATEARRHGLIEFIDDPTDARVRLVRFTDAGREMARIAQAAFRDIEASLARVIGAREVATLKRILSVKWPGDDRDTQDIHRSG
jgi:DNA-binding MarR family transcriptional regulator